MILIVALIALFALVVLNVLFSRNLLHPAVVHAGMWLYQLTGLLIFRDKFIEPSVDVILVVVLGAAMFTAGAHLSFGKAWDHSSFFVPRVVRNDVWIYWVILFLISMCLFWQYKIFASLVSADNFSEGLVLTRTLMSIEDKDVYGIYKYGNTLSLGALLLLQICILRNNNNLLLKKIFVYILVVTCLLAILSTGRGPLAQIAMFLALVYLLSGNLLRLNWNLIKIWTIVTFITFLIFWVMGSAMGKTGNTFYEVFNDIVSYQFSPIPALSVYLDNNPIPLFGGELGNGTFRFFYAIMASLGMADKPVSLVQDFVSVPNMTNIYTAYLLPIKDFGWAGVVSFPLFLGILHGRLFKWATMDRNNQFALYILVISYMPLLSSTGGDTYFSLVSTWIQFLLIGLFMTRRIDVPE